MDSNEPVKKTGFELKWWMCFLLWGLFYLVSGIFNTETENGLFLESINNILSVVFLVLGIVKTVQTFRKKK